MPGVISQSTLEQVRAASEIVEVIRSYLPLKRAGASWVALCPFHREKTPSFHVNPQRQIFHCFGCHKGGDVFTFVREIENISFMEAARRLAERARIALEIDEDPRRAQVQFVKEKLLEMHEQITQRWHTALLQDAASQVARDYLERRRVSNEAAKLFRLGYAPDLWDDTVNWARAKGYDPALVEQAGLIIRKEGEAHYYDRFRGRLMFPICDEQGRVIGFSGRVLAGDAKTAKYVNSPETPIFTKGRVMFGLDKSRRVLTETGFAVVCEGQLDLIACYMAGVRNVVAPQGTALTNEHARVLKRYVDEVVLCFDSDAAGQNATLRALDDLLSSGLSIRVALVPAPHDPDSFIKEQGGEAFGRLIQKAEGFFDYLLARLSATEDASSDRGRAAIVHGMGEAVLKTGNAVLVDTYAHKTARRLGVAVDAVRAEFAKLPKGRSQATDASAVEDRAAAGPRPGPHEFWLMKLLLLDDTLVPWAGPRLDLDWLDHPVVRRVVERRLALESAGQWRGVAALLSEFEDEHAQTLVTEALAEQREIPNREQQLADVVKRLRDRVLDRQIAQLTRKIEDEAASLEEKTALAVRRQQLKKAKDLPIEARVSEDEPEEPLPEGDLP